MALVKSDYTNIKTVDLGNTDYQLLLKVNSYKDGSLEATITDNLESLSIDVDLLDNTSKFFKQHLGIPIKKLLEHNGVSYDWQLLSNIFGALRQVMYDVKNFNGRPTLDYDRYECHGMVVVKKCKAITEDN